MALFIAVFGTGKDLDTFQMAARAIVAFACALVLIRVSGRRSFGQRSPFDYVVAILLGATLSRFIVGASPAVPTLAASLALVSMHRALGWLCVRSRWLETLVVGIEREVYCDGRFNGRQMSAALLTKADVLETLRRELHSTDLNEVHSATLERNGEISLIRKRP